MRIATVFIAGTLSISALQGMDGDTDAKKNAPMVPALRLDAMQSPASLAIVRQRSNSAPIARTIKPKHLNSITEASVNDPKELIAIEAAAEARWLNNHEVNQASCAPQERRGSVPEIPEQYLVNPSPRTSSPRTFSVRLQKEISRKALLTLAATSQDLAKSSPRKPAAVQEN